MNLEEILSISGKPGLYKVVTHGKGSLIVESLTDGKRIPVSIQKQMSALKDISIYTLSGEKPLAEVFEAIRSKHGDALPVTAKSSKSDLEEFFFGILSDYDEDRVYASDIKKIVQWYTALSAQGYFESASAAEPAAEPADAADDASAENAPPADPA